MFAAKIEVAINSHFLTAYQKMKQYSVDFIAGSFQRQTWDGDIYPGGYRYKDTLIEDGDYAVAEYRYGQGHEIFVATWNKLYKVQFLRNNNIRCIDGYMIDDVWFTYQVIMCARSCCLVSDCTLFYNSSLKFEYMATRP